MEWDAFKRHYANAQQRMNALKQNLINRIPNPVNRAVVRAADTMGQREVAMMQRNFTAFIAAVVAKAKGGQRQAGASQAAPAQVKPQAHTSDQPARLKATPEQIAARAAQMDGRASHQRSQERGHGRG